MCKRSGGGVAAELLQSDSFFSLSFFFFLLKLRITVRRLFPASTRHTHPLVLLFGPRSFDELRVENLLPPVLALHICAILAGQSTKEHQRHVLVLIEDEKVVQRRCVWREVRPLNTLPLQFEQRPLTVSKLAISFQSSDP